MCTAFSILNRPVWKLLFLGLWLLQASEKPSKTSPDFRSKFPDGLTPQQVESGWISLFDGQSMYGWRNIEGWKVENGAIVASEKSDKILRTGVQFDDYELRFEFQADAKSETSVLLRTSPNPGDNDACVLELKPGLAQNEWQERVITFKGSHLEARQKGPHDKAIVNTTIRKGYIGFRHLGGVVRIRNLHLRPLNLPAIFNGKNLAGWDDSQKMESEFKVASNGLQMLGGRGQLESKAKFGDFILTLQGRTNADGLNSGLFFRCIPNDIMNGYESQISNLIHDDDPARPQDCGTGGIFRRLNARIVNADDQAWFAKTIVADGATFCVWVNGSLVCDWTDRRKPHDNPRNGQRLKPGTLILQGHDPTTDISFKNISARELNPRRK